MAKENIYPYAAARIKAIETKLLTKKDYIQMAEAKNAEAAFRTIAEAGYNDLKADETVRDFENVLSAEVSKTYELLNKLVPGERFINVFLLKNDYHNLKVLIKSDISGSDGERFLIKGGTVPLEVLKEAVQKRSFSGLNAFMQAGITEAFESYAKTQNGQMIDLAIDKAAFDNMKYEALESKNEFVIEYVEILSDITNIKSFLRVKNMKKSFEMFENVCVSGGTLGLAFFKNAFGVDSLSQTFKSTKYSKLFDESSDIKFTAFEKLADNYMMDFMKKSKYMSISLEPIVAYLYAKEAEIKLSE